MSHLRKWGCWRWPHRPTVGLRELKQGLSACATVKVAADVSLLLPECYISFRNKLVFLLLKPDPPSSLQRQTSPSSDPVWHVEAPAGRHHAPHGGILHSRVQAENLRFSEQGWLLHFFPGGMSVPLALNQAWAHPFTPVLQQAEYTPSFQ